MWPASEGLQGIRLESFRHIVQQGSSIDLSSDVNFGVGCVNFAIQVNQGSSRFVLILLEINRMLDAERPVQSSLYIDLALQRGGRRDC